MFSPKFSWKVDPLLHYFQLYSKYFDYFDQLLPKFNNIFALTPLMHAFYWVFNIQFSQFSIWAWYYSLTRFKHFWPIWVFPKNGIINFSLCQKHHFDKTCIRFCFGYLNICLFILFNKSFLELIFNTCTLICTLFEHALCDSYFNSSFVNRSL